MPKINMVVANLLVLSVSVALCSALLLAYYAYRAIADPFPRTAVRLEGDFDFRADDEIGFVAREDSHTRRYLKDTDFSYHIYTDHRSARVNGPAEKTDDRVDLITVGGSYSRGHGMRNEESFTEKLKSLLDVRVANFALGSYGTTQSLQMLERNLDLDPKVIVYGFIEHHLVRNLNPCAPSFSPYCLVTSYVAFEDEDLAKPYVHRPQFEYFSWDLNRKFYQQIAMADKGVTLHDVLWKIRIDAYRLARSSVYRRSQSEARQRAAIRFLIREMAESARSIDALLLVVYIPDYLTPSYEPSPPPALLDAIEREDVVLVDMSRALLKHYADNPGQQLYLRDDDDHPNELAHTLIAQSIHETIVNGEGTRGRFGAPGSHGRAMPATSGQ